MSGTDGKAFELDAKLLEAKDTDQYPVIDLAQYLKKEGSWAEDCKKIAKLLHHFGFLLVRDPRVAFENNAAFLDMMEQYYEQPDEKKAGDIRKELSYQVGITPERTERARDHCSKVEKMADGEKPETLCPPDLDNKLRFFWRIGERPEKTEFAGLNADPVVPPAFPQWTEVMNTWGGLMMQAVNTVAEMAAQGFDLPADTFTKLMHLGPHLLAPTGSNFNKFGKKGTVLAAYHTDLNFLTIHGASRFPGLSVWTRDGKKLNVKVPPGCLLVQAGQQFEYLTGGYVLAGFHEVIVNDATVAAIEAAKKASRSLWRVSSTLFSHIASDNTLEPLGRFATEETRAKYPAVKAGQQVKEELAAIKLGAGEGEIAAM